MSIEKSFVTIRAAIGPQAKKRENGTLQESLPVRTMHFRAATFRAKPLPEAFHHPSGGAQILATRNRGVNNGTGHAGHARNVPLPRSNLQDQHPLYVSISL